MALYTEAIQKLYVAYFGRPADVPGLAFWDNAVARANGSTAAVAQAFAASQEYRQGFAGLDAHAVVDTIYHNLFGRPAEAEGLMFWGLGLKNGDFGVADAVTAIAAGAQGHDRVVLANKVAAATAFTPALEKTGHFIVYSGETMNGVLKAWLAGITTDASLAAAMAGLDNFIQDVLRGAPGLPQGSFEIFDTAGLDKTFDADILLSHSQAIEFTASGPVGAAALINVAPSSTVRVTGDMGASMLSVAQKTPGSLRITVDADEKGSPGPDVAIEAVTARIGATNAHTIQAVFDTSFLGPVPGEAGPGDNLVTLHLAGVAETVDVASSGAFARNVLVYTDIAPGGSTANIHISGDRGLSLSTVNAAALATIDASLHSGGLAVSTAAVRDGGQIFLGGGADTLTVAATSTLVIGLQKSAAGQIADVLAFGTPATVADAAPGMTGATMISGVLSFSGAGPANLDAAMAIADAAAETAGEALLFSYMADTVVFVQGGPGNPDHVVRLVGLSGAGALVEVGGGDMFMIV